MNFDIIIIGSGPGGYVAAIRAAQLGLKTAVIERSELGGICLNWGCIPTKALLKSAQVYNYASHAASYGLTIDGNIKANLPEIVERSRGVAAQMSKGVEFLFQKNGITHIKGTGKLTADKKVDVIDNDGVKSTYTSNNIILATGTRSKELPNLKQDGKKIIGYREAMTLKEKPESMVIVGSGAIGSEFAYFFQSIGTQVTLVEFLPNIIPLEDEESSKNLERVFKKMKMKVMTESAVTDVDTSEKISHIKISTKKGEVIIDAEIVLSAVGVTTNIENLGLENLNIKTEKGKIVVDDFYTTNVDGIYAIGDIVHGPALAHVASKEGIICVEKIAGKNPEIIDYNNIPSCTYTNPEVASVGMSEKVALEKAFEIRIGKFPFKASGKATSAGNTDGFVKIIIDAKTDYILGCSMVGDNVTEMISEIVLARKLGAKGKDLLDTVHPHPTMSEAVMEAIAASYGEAIHILN
ncbi:MAG: dihydrolipoyl dehydrogenase [Bacteroidetes bacterium CG2_30_33_31]|nr:MAG: dihydrolipoyl dehydrogenase [Bacteroidetes bacterium CG2_30_33_31]